MENNFFDQEINELTFRDFLKNIENCKVGFYSVGLYPASLAYNCAMHSKKQNILLAPRPGRELLGAFSKDLLSSMNPIIINRIMRMATPVPKKDKNYNDLSDLIMKCDIVFLAANSNHIQNDISLAIKLKKKLHRENIVLACLVGSFCIDDKDKNPFVLCERYPNLAFFTGFHRHGALRNSKDSFSANFCHPDSLTSLIGTKILNELSPKIQVSAGVHNVECQYIKAIKNVSSIFAGFVNSYHSDKPGMLPTVNSVLLSQCFDQAASVASVIRKENKVINKYVTLNDLGYGAEMIKAQEIKKNEIVEIRDHTFSQLNAVTADVLGSMSLPTEGKPTRNFQAGQVLSEMLLRLKRCPNDISEYIHWCDNSSLRQGDLEGLKSLKFWPYIYKKYSIRNNNSSMINLIYLCFYASNSEKKDIYEVLINEEEIINYCQESVKPNINFEVNNKLLGIDIFSDQDILFNRLFSKKLNKYKSESKILKEFVNGQDKYLKVMKLINKYFTN